MPLKNLLKIITPRGLFPSPEEFHHVTTLLVNAVLKRKRKRFHWVYLAHTEIPFYRVGFYPVHPHPACYLEKSVAPGFVINREKVREELEFTLKTLKLIESREEIVFFDARIIPVSYILFAKNWWQKVPPTLNSRAGHAKLAVPLTTTLLEKPVNTALKLSTGFTGHDAASLFVRGQR